MKPKGDPLWLAPFSKKPKPELAEVEVITKFADLKISKTTRMGI